MYDYCTDGWRLTFEEEQNLKNNQSTGIKQNTSSYLASRYVGETMDCGGLQEFPHQIHLDFTRLLEYWSKEGPEGVREGVRSRPSLSLE